MLEKVYGNEGVKELMLSAVDQTESSSFNEPNIVEYLQIPDFQFVSLCFERYGLNRGIYNTIDEWLYDHGIRDIIARRQTIVRFLIAHQHRDCSKGTYLKFGKGGLTKRLYEFISGYEQGGHPSG